MVTLYIYYSFKLMMMKKDGQCTFVQLYVTQLAKRLKLLRKTYFWLLTSLVLKYLASENQLILKQVLL